mgnify:CR=1 FL=1
MIIKIFLTSFVMWLLLFGFTVLLAVSDEKVDPLKREDYKKIIDKLKNITSFLLLLLVILGAVVLFAWIW